MTPHKTGDSSSIVRGVRTHTPTLASAHHKGDCLPKSVTSVTGYGSHGLGKHAPDVSGQHEPTDANHTRQHHNYAAEGLGSHEHSIAPVLGK